MTSFACKVESPLTLSKKADIIHVETKSDIHGFHACLENSDPANGGVSFIMRGGVVDTFFGANSDRKVEWKAF